MSKDPMFEKMRSAMEHALVSEAEISALEGTNLIEKMMLKPIVETIGENCVILLESIGPVSAKRFLLALSGVVATTISDIERQEREENENKKKQEIEDRRIENSEYNRANDEFFNTYFSSGIENYDSELAKLEADKQLGVYNGYEENYKNRKSELNAARGNAYNQIHDKYINDILKNDNNKDFLEIKKGMMA